MTPLSKHFSLEELTVSQWANRRGYNNIPTGVALAHLKQAVATFEKVRELLGKPMLVSSGYRSSAVNKAVGGAPNSAHLHGWAIDFTSPGFGTPYDVATAIAESDIRFDQLIHEYPTSTGGGWVHLSADPQFRMQKLTKYAGSGRYLPGILPALKPMAA